MDARTVKWGVVVVAAALAASAAGAFTIAYLAGGWARVVLGPLCLWWAAQLVAVSVSATLSAPGPWPRDDRARYLVFLSAALVGGWIGCRLPAWPALAVLPLYAPLEWAVVARVWPPDEISADLGLPVWLTLVLLGEAVGYLAAGLTCGRPA